MRVDEPQYLGSNSFRCPCCCSVFQKADGYKSLKVNGKLEHFCSDKHFKYYSIDMLSHTDKVNFMKKK